MSIPNIWENSKKWQPNHQPENVSPNLYPSHWNLYFQRLFLHSMPRGPQGLRWSRGMSWPRPWTPLDKKQSPKTIIILVRSVCLQQIYMYIYIYIYIHMYLYTCYNYDYDIINHNDDTNSNDSNILNIITANTIKHSKNTNKNHNTDANDKITMNYLMIITIVIVNNSNSNNSNNSKHNNNNSNNNDNSNNNSITIVLILILIAMIIICHHTSWSSYHQWKSKTSIRETEWSAQWPKALPCSPPGVCVRTWGPVASPRGRCSSWWSLWQMA